MEDIIENDDLKNNIRVSTAFGSKMVRYATGRIDYLVNIYIII